MNKEKNNTSMEVSDGQKCHFLGFVMLKCSIISSTDRKHVAMEVL